MENKYGGDATIREIMLCAVNEGTLHTQACSLAQAMAKRLDKGTYQEPLAVKAWLYWVESALRWYAKHHCAGGIKWSALLTVREREDMARQCLTQFSELVDSYRKGDANNA